MIRLPRRSWRLYAILAILFIVILLHVSLPLQPRRKLLANQQGPPFTSTSPETDNDNDHNNPNIRYLFSFGDSFTETDFNILTDTPNTTLPFGRATLGHASAGGPNWLQFLIRDLATPSEKYPTLVYNFAAGGAVVDFDVFKVEEELRVPAFVEQTGEFVNYLGKEEVGWNAENSIFVIWFGVNDVHFGYRDAENFDDLMEIVYRRYAEQIGVLHKAGARKFVLLTVPPLWRSSWFSVAFNYIEPKGQVATMISKFNTGLQAHVSQFLSTHHTFPFTTISILDTTPVFHIVLNNPTKNGAPNATCEDDGKTFPEDVEDGVRCLWYDKLHPGRALHLAVAKAVFERLEVLRFWA